MIKYGFMVMRRDQEDIHCRERATSSVKRYDYHWVSIQSYGGFFS